MRAHPRARPGDRVLVRLRLRQPLIVTVTVALFPIISSTLFGLQSAERNQHDLLSLYRASRLTRLVKLQLPAALPAILTGLQVSATLAVVGAVVGDFAVVQMDWFAESEYGAYFQLLGDQPRFDTANQRVTAPLVDAGAPNGVDLEIRYGGPVIGFQQVSAQMYADPSITFGLVSRDEAIQNSNRLATRAVLAPLELSPLMIIWSKAEHPEITSIADLGRSGIKILYYQADAYMVMNSGRLREC